MSVQCPHCQTENTDEAKFCSNCGRSLEVAEQPSVPGPAGPIGMQAPPPATGVPPFETAEEPAAQTTEYAGFWIRFAAFIIDGVIVSAGGWILVVLSFPSSLVWILSVAYAVLFIGLRGQTPGKMALGLQVIKPGYDVPGIGTALMREVVGKIVSTITLLIGFIWVAFDPQKQGFHDKIAGTYVVRVVRQPQRPPIER
ncbi:MAG: RDD family protein [Chloroflexi bacterium]|nr:RDD family protein [Chloroflexota bacterium]